MSYGGRATGTFGADPGSTEIFEGGSGSRAGVYGGNGGGPVVPAQRAPEPRREAENADVAAPAAGKPRKRRRLVGVLAIVFLLVILAGGGGGSYLQLHRTLPAPALKTTLASAVSKIPGTLSLPWPTKGSAELWVNGIGTLGGSAVSVPKPIGSVAKVMTAHLVLKDHPLAAGETGPGITVTAADVADYKARLPAGQSLVRVAAGEVLTERDALEALMLPSANNVARILAIWDAGSEPAFLAKMNTEATTLGMTGTEYTDPSGFLPTTVSTAHDQVLLGRSAIGDATFSQIVAMPSATIPVQGKISNYNDLLGVDGIFGIKTGSTDQAGGNLLFASHFTIGNVTLTLVGTVFSQPGAATPQQLAAVDKVVRKLMSALRAAVKTVVIIPLETVGKIRTAWGSDSDIRTAATVSVAGLPGQTVKTTVSMSGVSQLGHGQVIPAGNQVGSVHVTGPFGTADTQLLTAAQIAGPSTWWQLTRKPGASTVS